MITVRDIKTQSEFDAFKDLQGDELHIVKISAPWCGPCRVLASTIKGLDSSKIGTTLFAEVSMEDDETEDIASALNIRNIPVLIFYKNGAEVKRTVGAISAEEIYKNINELQ